MPAPDPHPFAPVFTPLRALHTLSGRYVHLDAQSFRQIGLDIATLLGRSWQEFAPGPEVDAETVAVSRAVHAGRSIELPAVRRSWGGHAIRLAVSVHPVRSPGGTSLILREARVLAGPPASSTREETGPMAALRSLAGL